MLRGFLFVGRPHILLCYKFAKNPTYCKDVKLHSHKKDFDIHVVVFTLDRRNLYLPSYLFYNLLMAKDLLDFIFAIWFDVSSLSIEVLVSGGD
jgi:hypothetical protein